MSKALHPSVTSRGASTGTAAIQPGAVIVPWPAVRGVRGVVAMMAPSQAVRHVLCECCNGALAWGVVFREPKALPHHGGHGMHLIWINVHKL